MTEDREQGSIFGLGTTIIAGLAGAVIGNNLSKPPDNSSEIPAYMGAVDNIMLTLNESELISFTTMLSRCTYLRSVRSLAKEWEVQQDKRSLRHLQNCATKALKTPYLSKVIIYHVKGSLGSSLLLNDGITLSKTITVSPQANVSLMSPGVSQILATILSVDSDQDVISVKSSLRTGSHNRFNISPRATFFEALSYYNKDMKSFSDISDALNVYYSVLLSELPQIVRDCVLDKNFNFKCFMPIAYKYDGFGYVTNFYKIMNSHGYP